MVVKSTNVLKLSTFLETCTQTWPWTKEHARIGKHDWIWKNLNCFGDRSTSNILTNTMQVCMFTLAITSTIPLVEFVFKIVACEIWAKIFFFRNKFIK